MATSLLSLVQPAAPTTEVDPAAAAAKAAAAKAAAAKAAAPAPAKAAAAKGADPVDPPPPPAEDTPDSASLDTQADALRSEISGLEAKQDGVPTVMTRASVEEREAATLSEDEIESELSEKRKKLTGIVSKIVDRQKGGSDFAELPAEVAPGEQHKSSGPVYPGRSRARADEKLRQAETGVYTSERMRPGAYEYFRSGPGMGETEVRVEGESKPRRYAVGRRRRALYDVIKPETPLTSDNPLYALPRDMAVGLYRRFTGDELTEQEASTTKEYRPRRGGIMSAPRGEVNEAKLSLEMAERQRGIGGAKKEIIRLKKEIPNLKDPAQHYASIAVLEDDIEQLRAEQTQLMRVKNVTIPRQIAEEEAAEKADKLKDRFATKF